MRRNCEQCGRGFNAKPYDVRRGFGRFCSRECGRAGLRGGGKADAWRKFWKGRWYRRWREPGSRKIHQQLESRWTWERAHGPIPEGYEIHHKDEDQTNNALDNLACVTIGWHDDYHQRKREDHRIIDGVGHRRCQRCGAYKPFAEFARRKAGTFHGYCKPCVRDYLREWRERNRERWNAYHRTYRQRKP